MSTGLKIAVGLSVLIMCIMAAPDAKVTDSPANNDRNFRFEVADPGCLRSKEKVVKKRGNPTESGAVNSNTWAFIYKHLGIYYAFVDDNGMCAYTFKPVN